MARSKSSAAWLKRHVNDPYVHRAEAQGYRSRSAFKLLELDARDRFLAPGQRVVDLGAAPGGWSQVAAAKVGRTGTVIAVDLLEMAPIDGVTVLRGDFTDQATLSALQATVAGERLDVVLSDMAPNLSGIAASDQARSLLLCELAAEFALSHLKPGGAFAVKTFQGAGFEAFLAAMRRDFRQVASRKPGASRRESAEVYLVARRR